MALKENRSKLMTMEMGTKIILRHLVHGLFHVTFWHQLAMVEKVNFSQYSNQIEDILNVSPSSTSEGTRRESYATGGQLS